MAYSLDIFMKEPTKLSPVDGIACVSGRRSTFEDTLDFGSGVGIFCGNCSIDG